MSGRVGSGGRPEIAGNTVCGAVSIFGIAVYVAMAVIAVSPRSIPILVMLFILFFIACLDEDCLPIRDATSFSKTH